MKPLQDLREFMLRFLRYQQVINVTGRDVIRYLQLLQTLRSK